MLHKRKHSIDTESAAAVEELSVQTEPLACDTNIQAISNITSSPGTTLQVSQIELDTRENHAAIVIQSAFRAFLVLYSILYYHIILLLLRLRKARDILQFMCHKLKVR